LKLLVRRFGHLSQHKRKGLLIWGHEGFRDSELILELKELFLEWDNEFAALARSALSALSLRDPGPQEVLATLLVFMSVTSWRDLVRIQGLPAEEAAPLASKLVTCSLRP
jgi:hypothetical protein